MIGETILAAAKAIHCSHHHPRLILMEEDFARLRKNRQTGIYQKLLDYTIEQADGYLGAAPCTYLIPDGIRLLEVSREVQTRVMTLSIAYQVTGEEKYAERACAEMEAVAAFSDWHPYHFLDVATMCAACALGYDWLYSYMSEERRAVVRRALIEKGLAAIMDDYRGNPDRSRSYHWYQDKPGDNWKFICNGSLAMAVLAIFDDEDCDDYNDVLTCGFEDSLEAVKTFYREEDGTYSEGLGYWGYGTMYLAYYASSLRTAAGSDFGLTDWVGLKKSPYFILSLSSPDQMSFNFGDATASNMVNHLFLWFAQLNGHPGLAQLRTDCICNGSMTIDDVLYYRDTALAPLDQLPLDFGGVGMDNAAFRSDRTNEAFYAAIHYGANHAYHGHHDMGTFVMNIGSKRFFSDLGADNYNLTPYRDTYRFRAEGHNTIVINPSPHNDQIEKSCADINRFSAAPDSFVVADMSQAYPTQNVVRGLKMFRDCNAAVLQDEIHCAASDVIRWSAHTQANIDLADNARSAILELDGVKMLVAILGSDGSFEVLPAAPDALSPKVQPAASATSTVIKGQAENTGFFKLAIHVTGRTEYCISVLFYPLTDGKAIPDSLPKVKPLAAW